MRHFLISASLVVVALTACGTKTPPSTPATQGQPVATTAQLPVASSALPTPSLPVHNQPSHPVVTVPDDEEPLSQPASVTTASQANPWNIRVRIFSAEWCGPCRSLHQFLDGQGWHDAFFASWPAPGGRGEIRIETIDVDSREHDAINRTRRTGYVPEVQILRGDEIVYVNPDQTLPPDSTVGWTQLLRRFSTPDLLISPARYSGADWLDRYPRPSLIRPR